jgi:hypothetical protein
MRLFDARIAAVCLALRDDHLRNDVRQLRRKKLRLGSAKRIETPAQDAHKDAATRCGRDECMRACMNT